MDRLQYVIKWNKQTDLKLLHILQALKYINKHNIKEVIPRPLLSWTGSVGLCCAASASPAAQGWKQRK